MNAWYKFILNVLFSKKSENKDWEMTDEEEDILANYIELDSLMPVHACNPSTLGGRGRRIN